MKIEIVEIADEIACIAIDDSKNYFYYQKCDIDCVKNRIFRDLFEFIDACIDKYRLSNYEINVFHNDNDNIFFN